jgi:two-component system sensor histidine kinase DesK
VGVVISGVWLAFLAGAVQAAWALAGQPQGRVALAALAGFVASYLWVFAHVPTLRWQQGRRAPLAGVLLLVAMAALAAVVIATLGQDGVSTLVFLAAVGMQLLPSRAGLGFVFVVAIGNDVAGRVVPGWTEDASLTLAIAATGLAMWGVRQIIVRNRELVIAREENARLAVAGERDRFARDLHDILGHSLTVVTVKAELAERLVETDPARARAELDDIQRLTRDALAEVRQVVTGYRQPSLSGELARARQALAAAGIAADLPNSTDVVPSALRELFAWTIREGVTNVVRHSGARHCTVVLGPDAVQVIDDGRGPGDAGPGHGLVGLRERAAQARATVVTESLDPGFALRLVAHG